MVRAEHMISNLRHCMYYRTVPVSNSIGAADVPVMYGLKFCTSVSTTYAYVLEYSKKYRDHVAGAFLRVPL